LNKLKLLEDVSLQTVNSFGINVTASRFVSLDAIEQCPELVDMLDAKAPADYLLLGGGSNLLFTQDFQGTVLDVNIKGKQLVSEDSENHYVEAHAGENWHEFVLWTIDQGYAGLENLSLIPGTVGAAPMQNIGAYGVELADRFHTLKALDLETGNIDTFDLNACEFEYRHSYFKENLGRYLILSVIFKLPKQAEWKTDYAGVREALANQTLTAKTISDAVIQIRQSKLPDPNVLGNAGSFFKNPILNTQQYDALKAVYENLPAYAHGDAYKTSAAWLIDQCGWKGKTQGNAGVYDKHALILINATGNASGAEIWQLAQDIMASVNDKFGVQLEPEPRVL
jgi:UDP-N-acetylmuramate dehydrogenase